MSYGGDSGYPITWRSVQPRLGVTYAMGQDRQTLVRASYARFANELGTDVGHINAFPGVASLFYRWTDANQNGRVEPPEVDTGELLGWWGVDPEDPGSAAPVNQIAANLEPPETDEFILGVERQLFLRPLLSLAYTFRRLTGPLFSPLIGAMRASYRYEGNATGTIRDPTTGFVLDFSEPYYGLTTDPAPNGSVLRNRPDTTETYDGLELQMMKSFSNGWMLRVGFAYNNWRQQVGGGGIVDPNNEVPGSNASGPIVEGIINATWQFNVSGTVELPLAIQAGVNFFGRQGFPILYSVLVEANDTRFSAPALQIGSATTYRTPNVYQLDLQLSRAFALGSRMTVTPIFACFNLLDRRRPRARARRVSRLLRREGVAGFRSDPAFDAVAWTLSHMTFRSSVRISF